MDGNPSTGIPDEPLQAMQLPAGPPSVEFCRQLECSMHRATWAGVDATKQALTPQLLQSIVLGVTPILNKEPTLIEVQPAPLQQRVTLVGDTHGQYHDVCRLFERFGHPSKDRIYVFNGDYVDRGAWGVETLALLLAWKWALPRNVYLLRGNHETNTITRIYGFYAELRAKYGAESKGLFTHIRRLFACLPLAALIANASLVLHGGLFRAPPKMGKGSKRRRSTGVRALTLGTLDDLRQATKGGQDPDPERSSKNFIASDVMWSDPVNTPGIRPNDARGCGTVYGPDVTQSFLADNGLRLIIRSHEGPDARDKRLEGDKMPSVDSGYAVDHEGPNGKLVTLFSAPDYPQFMAEGEQRYHNRGAVITLSAPDYATPEVASFEAVLPRPAAESYYDLPGWSDEEEELAQQSDDEKAVEHRAGAAAAAPSAEHTASAMPAGVMPLPAADAATAAAGAAPQVEASAIDTVSCGAASIAAGGLECIPATEAVAETAAPLGIASAEPAVAAGGQPVGSCLHAADAVGCNVNGLHSTSHHQDEQQPTLQQQELLMSERSDEPGASSTAGQADSASEAAATALSKTQQPQQQQQPPEDASKRDCDHTCTVPTDQAGVIDDIVANCGSPGPDATDDVDERPAKRHKPGVQ